MPLRILTANVLHVHADAGAFASLLDRWTPDVVAVQELGSRLATEIDARFAHTDLEPTDDPHGMGMATSAPAVFDRLPLPHTDGWRATLAGGPSVVSVHVRNPIDLPPLEANRNRRAQVDALLGHVAATSGPLVLAGDFNASPAWPAYRRLASVLDDAVASVLGRRARAARTWGPRVLGGRKLLRIDHVFVRGLRPVDAVIEPIPGSDHAALVVDVE